MNTTDHAAHSPIIVLSGGGTGGHITPILAVAHELKQVHNGIKTVYVGEKNGAFKSFTTNNKDIDQSYEVRAGKFRRYHGESWLTRLSDVKTNLLNLRDVFNVLVGIWQAWWLLGQLKPSIVFLKGGFVGVPVGIAAGLRNIPIVTHDSDAIPGLANRLVSRWVNVHATALPAKEYPYPADKVVHVGVLVEHSYEYVSKEKKQAYRQQLKLPEKGKVLLITGGSSGAERINQAVRQIAPELLQALPDLEVVHQVGKGKQGVYDGFSHERLHVLEFLRPMYVYMGAADVVVARASANTIAELEVQGKATIVVPSPFLAGGHQLENAKRLEAAGIALVVQEDAMLDPETGLLATICKLFEHDRLRIKLANVIHMQAIPDAAKRLANLLIDQMNP
jgi:UDP-N-acetylglucosamine--N-acetylmuramyl-(pentapeptide) pyrophosphoryl-undecaprenol N-acetylglucosamine transferase